jgi:membrane-bound ClpP family serine protease
VIFNKIKIGLLTAIILSLLDEAIILAIAIIVLLQLKIDIPLWAIIVAAFLFFAVTFFAYLAIRKSPQLGFENMVGLRGITVEPVGRKGTIRINGGLWYARSRGENIMVGVEVLVVEQIGLKLTVVPIIISDQKSPSVRSTKSNPTALKCC